jgi:uncharacterized membrane protein (UPF0127 family)
LVPSQTRVLTIVVVVSIVLIGAYTLIISNTGPGPVTTNVPSSFTVNGKTFHFTYVATTQSERTSGLMNRKITNMTTMLFVFPSSGEWSFWMYDTNTSLDMIWVNASGTSGRVVYLVTAAQPCLSGGSCTLYTPTSPANYVIEGKAGFAAANGISVGAFITFG